MAAGLGAPSEPNHIFAGNGCESESNEVEKDAKNSRIIEVGNGSGWKNGEAGGGNGNSVIAEVKLQCSLAWPMIVANVVSYSYVIVSVMFVGHLGEVELSSVSLANSFAVVSGYSVMMGLAMGLETLCGQAYGAKRYHLLGVYLQTSIMVTATACIPILIVWLNMEKILLAVGQDPQISRMAALYLHHMLPGVFSAAINSPLMKYLQTQSIVVPVMINSLITAILHPFICYTLIHVLGFGYYGGAMATTGSFCFLFILNLTYVLFSKKCGECWGGFAIREAFGMLGMYLSLALPSLLMTCLEWWSFELLVLWSGLLPKPSLELSLLTICLNTINFSDTIPLGLCVAASIRVSNELGANRPDAAKLVVKVVLGLAILNGCIVSVALMLARNFWGHAFSNVVEVVDYVAQVTPLLALLTFIDPIQYAFSGVVRGSGRQALGATINLTSYYVIGIPACILLAFWLHLNGKGLVMGLACAVFLQTTFVIILVSYTNWRKMADKAQERVARAPPENEPLLPSQSPRLKVHILTNLNLVFCTGLTIAASLQHIDNKISQHWFMRAKRTMGMLSSWLGKIVLQLLC